MKSIFTLSNLLSLSRIVLLIPFIYFLSLESARGNYSALAISVVIILSDYLDGILARRMNAITTIGNYLDTMSDKVCIFTTAIYLAFFRGTLPLWYALLLIIKDLVIVAGGIYLVITRKFFIHSELSGKWSVFIVSITLILYILNFTVLAKYFIVISLLFILHSSWQYMQKFYMAMKQDH